MGNGARFHVSSKAYGSCSQAAEPSGEWLSFWRGHGWERLEKACDAPIAQTEALYSAEGVERDPLLSTSEYQFTNLPGKLGGQFGPSRPPCGSKPWRGALGPGGTRGLFGWLRGLRFPSLQQRAEQP